MTMYAVMVDPIVMPDVIIVLGTLVFLFAGLDIAIDIIIKAVFERIRDADHNQD